MIASVDSIAHPEPPSRECFREWLTVTADLIANIQASTIPNGMPRRPSFDVRMQP